LVRISSRDREREREIEREKLPRAVLANCDMADCSRSGLVACTTNNCWNDVNFLQTNGGNSCSHWLLRE